MNGTKHDMGKAQLSLIPYEALKAEAAAFEFGVKKYSRNNYKGGFKQSRLLDACLRHVMAYAHGENNDLESGISHLGHARACLGMLLQNIADGRSEDDR